MRIFPVFPAQEAAPSSAFLRPLLIFLALALLWLITGQSSAQAVAPPATTAAFAPGEVLVGLAPDELPAARTSPASIDDLTGIPAFTGLSLAGAEVLAQSAGPAQPLIVRLRVADGEEPATIARLRAAPTVAFAEPNWLAFAAALPADSAPTPLLPNDPLFRPNQWGMQRIGASRAWAISQGSAIRVAVIDSGVDLNHPEFAGRILPGKNYVSPDPGKCPLAQSTPQDDSGHGTHVTGIIAAALNNSEGVAGVAPRVLIDPRKALNCVNAGTVVNIAQAIRDAADNGAKIINLSLTVSEYSSVLESAVTYAVGKGILLVGAVGNSAPNPVWWPAAFPGVVAVAATDRSDQRAYYSHTGAVDLAAPGGLPSQLIHSTWPAGIGCPTGGPNYCTASGTSMSAAYVSGAAALVWGTRPDLSLVQLRNLLLETARKTGAPSSDVGAGRLDVHAAVRKALLSDLQPSRAHISALASAGASAFTDSLALANPSGELIFWQASVSSGSQWLAVQPSSGTQSAGGSARYGEPARLSLVITPTQLPPNDYSGALSVVGTRTNNSQVNLTIPVDLYVRAGLNRAYLSQTGRSLGPLEWQTPDGGGKQIQQMGDSTSLGLLLPFTFTVEAQAVTTVRLYADGFLTFPASESVASLPVACTPDETPAQQAIYAWWTDLNPGQGGTVSTFTSTSGAFVAEFLDVPLAAPAVPEDRVSFQIALFPDGAVKLNYAALPRTAVDVAVGMEVKEGLFSARIGCRKGSSLLGALPVVGESVTIRAVDLR